MTDSTLVKRLEELRDKATPGPHPIIDQVRAEFAIKNLCFANLDTIISALAETAREGMVLVPREFLKKLPQPEGRFFLSQFDAEAEGITQYWAYERGCGHALAMISQRIDEAIKAPPASPLAASSQSEMSKAAQDVLAERRRQVEQEGWTPEHDDQHNDGSLASAAAAYALAAAAESVDRAVLNQFGPEGLTFSMRAAWPASWDLRWFKPKSRRSDLVKAGAMILAEIERLDRLAASSQESGI